MSLTIQHVSPSYVRRCLMEQLYGTFVLRYSTNNDELIHMIRFDNHSKHELALNRYIILSIRVDETIYKREIEHYLLPYTTESIQGDKKQLLEPYNRLQKHIKNEKFTQLKQELILPRENGNFLFDKKCLQDLDFGSIKNAGKHNAGISKGYWQCQKQHDIKVFVKRFDKNSWHFAHELSLVKDLCYFSIISFYGYFTDDKSSYLVFEDGGDSLESRCPLRCPSTRIKMRYIANIGCQVAQAMMYLEKKNIVHRDLTAGNVLINSYGFIRIIDFGHAVKKEEGRNTLERSQSKSGVQHFQYRFLAPECLPNIVPRVSSNTLIPSSSSTPTDVYARFSSKSDVWSFGILLIQLMLDNPHTPYPHILNTDDIPEYVKINGKIHPQPKDCPTDMYLVLERCWAYEAIHRISFMELREKMITLETILR